MTTRGGHARDSRVFISALLVAALLMYLVAGRPGACIALALLIAAVLVVLWSNDATSVTQLGKRRASTTPLRSALLEEGLSAGRPRGIASLVAAASGSRARGRCRRCCCASAARSSASASGRSRSRCRCHCRRPRARAGRCSGVPRAPPSSRHKVGELARGPAGQQPSTSGKLRR